MTAPTAAVVTLTLFLPVRPSTIEVVCLGGRADSLRGQVGTGWCVTPGSSLTLPLHGVLQRTKAVRDRGKSGGGLLQDYWRKSRTLSTCDVPILHRGRDRRSRSWSGSYSCFSTGYMYCICIGRKAIVVLRVVVRRCSHKRFLGSCVVSFTTGFSYVSRGRWDWYGCVMVFWSSYCHCLRYLDDVFRAWARSSTGHTQRRCRLLCFCACSGYARYTVTVLGCVGVHFRVRTYAIRTGTPTFAGQLRYRIWRFRTRVTVSTTWTFRLSARPYFTLSCFMTRCATAPARLGLPPVPHPQLSLPNGHTRRYGVPGSSPSWKQKDFFQPCCDPQLIGNSWPGTRETWMQWMGFRSLTTLWWVWSTHLPPLRSCICALIQEGGGVPADAENWAFGRVWREPWIFLT